MNKTGAKIFGLIVLIFGIVGCAVGFWLLSSPARYEAGVKIKIDPENVDGNGSSTYDPYFVQIESEVIQSQAVLGKVIRTLNLNETVDHLRRQIKIRSVRNTYFIEIRVTRENAEEAAKIANAIAESFRDFRREQRRQMIAKGIQTLEEHFQWEEQNIKQLQQKADQLRTELKVPEPEPADDLLKSNFPSYFEAVTWLKNSEELHQLVKQRIDLEKTGATLFGSGSSSVEIVEPAVPPLSPTGPNRWLGIFLFLCGLVMSVSGFRLVSSERTA